MTKQILLIAALLFCSQGFAQQKASSEVRVKLANGKRANIKVADLLNAAEWVKNKMINREVKNPDGSVTILNPFLEGGYVGVYREFSTDGADAVEFSNGDAVCQKYGYQSLITATDMLTIEGTKVSVFDLAGRLVNIKASLGYDEANIVYKSIVCSKTKIVRPTAPPAPEEDPAIGWDYNEHPEGPNADQVELMNKLNNGLNSK